MKRGASRAGGWGYLATLVRGRAWDREGVLNTPAPLCPARRHQALVVRGGETFVKSRLLPRRLLQLRCAGIPSPRMCPPLPTACMWS